MKKYIVILVGESGTGKGTVFNLLAHKYGFTKIPSHLTRPLRDDEVDGFDVISETDESFKQHLESGDVLAHTKVKGYDYWKSKADFLNSEGKTVCILEPTGVLEVASELSKIMSRKEALIFIMRINLDETERFKRLIKDKPEADRFKTVTVQGVLDRMARDGNNFTAINLHDFCDEFVLVDSCRDIDNVKSAKTADFINKIINNHVEFDEREEKRNANKQS